MLRLNKVMKLWETELLEVPEIRNIKEIVRPLNLGVNVVLRNEELCD